MRGLRTKLIWFFSGVILTHVGHFIYQKCYARDFGAIKLSEFIAMIVEDLLKLLFQFLDTVLPWFVAYKIPILVVLGLLVFMSLFFFWYKVYLRIQTHFRHHAKIKEAETVLAATKQKAATQAKKIETLKKKLATEFENKENALQAQLKEKLKRYILRIKKLEQEQLELKEINRDLVRQVKAAS